MATQIQVRGATQSTQEARTLVSREIDVNTTDWRLTVHNGSTAGGIRHVNSFDDVNQEFVYAAASGTDTITISLAVAPSAYQSGQKFCFKAAATNTGSATLNVNSLGAKTIKKVSGGALVTLSAGDIVSGVLYTVFYDGTDMQLFSSASGSSPKSTVSATGQTINFPDIFTSGNNYRIEFNKIRTNDNANLFLLLATSGSSWITSSNYKYRIFGVGGGGTLLTSGSENGSSGFLLTTEQMDPTDNNGASGTIWIQNPQNATRALKITGTIVFRGVGNAMNVTTFGGEYAVNAAMGSFQIDLEGTNVFTDGSVSVYEYPNT